MPDTGSNIIIDITGNTANMATDFASSGSGITNAHVPIQKIAFGDDTVTNRVSSSNPLPITIQSYQSNVGISGDVGITGGRKGSNMLYLSGIQSEKVLTNDMIDRVVFEVEKKASELKNS